MNFTYPKIERLRSKILIDKVFTEGSRIYAYPFKLLWLIHPLSDATCVQSVVSVSKRRFKRANKRNLLKRRIREAFRTNKNGLYQVVENAGIQVCIAIIYNSNNIEDYRVIKLGIKDLFVQLVQKLRKIKENS